MTSNNLAKIIKYLLYVLALTPLIITPFTIYPFVFGRGIFIQIIIEVAFALYVVLSISNKNYRPRINSITKVFAIFLFFLFLSSILGLDFNNSFWGSEQRFTGWFFLLHIFLFFIVISSVLKSKNEWKNYIGFNVIVALVGLSIASLSLFGIKFWGVDLGTRISGSLGNTLFFASYLILNFAFAFYLFSESKNKKYKLFWLVILFILIYGVLLTQSRGALVGVISGLFFAFIYYGFYFKNKKVRSIIAGLILFIILISSFVYIFRDYSFINNVSFLRRFTKESFTTADTRFLSWKIAVDAIYEKPILGWGVENFDLAFNKYYNPELLKFSYYETWFDRPHNKILELGVDGGVVAIILYLVIFIIVFKQLNINRREGRISLLTASAVGGVLIAYFVQNLFVFDTSTSYLLFALLLAIITSINSDDSNIEIKKIPLIYILIGCLILFLPVYFLNISPLYASINLRENTTLFDSNQKINIEGYKKGMQYFNPYKEEWRVDLSQTVISSLRQQNNIYTDEEQDFAISELNKNIIEHKNNAYYHMLLGGFYAELAKDNKYKDLALVEFDRALKLSPNRQHIYFNLGRMYAVIGDRDNTINVFQKAINLKDDIPLSYWEGARQLFVLNSDDEQGFRWMIKAIELNFLPSDKQEFLFVFNKSYDYFLENKNYGVLLGFMSKIQDIEPNNPAWYAQEATINFILKDYQVAINNINKAINLDENYRNEGEVFLQIINNEITK